MTVSSISPALHTAGLPEGAAPAASPDKLGEASRQFESILLRQFLTESMGPLLEGGEAGKVYGYLLTETLADSLSKGGGLGFSSVLQAQLGKDQP